MITSYEQTGLRVQIDKRGTDEYLKMSYPMRTGVYSVVETRDLELHFNLNDELIRAKGRGRSWIHPHEWLKRSMGNDWIYYSTGGYTGVFEATGEYYLPNLQYATNALLGGQPFAEPQVSAIIEDWHQKLQAVHRGLGPAPKEIHNFFDRILSNSPERLAAKAEELFSICGGRTSVLPPDSRHVDYDVIPLTITEGCLYKCRFCKVKNGKPFSEMASGAIDEQLQRLRRLYNRDLANYNSIFLGEHDALQASPGHLLHATEEAVVQLGLQQSNLKGSNVFLFGSVGALLGAPESLFRAMSALPSSIYINVGLESADQATLDRLGKPVTSREVREAFARIQDINDRYQGIEVTANFVIDDGLPDSHIPSMLDLLREQLPRTKVKGAVYLSPLEFGKPSRSQVYAFNRLKSLSRVPTYLYIIQRL